MWGRQTLPSSFSIAPVVVLAIFLATLHKVPRGQKRRRRLSTNMEDKLNNIRPSFSFYFNWINKMTREDNTTCSCFTLFIYICFTLFISTFLQADLIFLRQQLVYPGTFFRVCITTTLRSEFKLLLRNFWPFKHWEFEAGRRVEEGVKGARQKETPPFSLGSTPINNKAIKEAIQQKDPRRHVHTFADKRHADTRQHYRLYIHTSVQHLLTHCDCTWGRQFSRVGRMKELLWAVVSAELAS